MKIGRNLQALIQKKELETEYVRTSLGWDTKTFEKILADELSPGISELLRLATLLGVDISSLLFGKELSERKAIKTSPAERVRVNRRNFLQYESLAPAYSGRHLEPFVVDVYPEQDGLADISRHSGEEFLFLLSGRLQVTVAGEEFELEPGDSFYFDSSQPHSIRSRTEHSRMVAVIYNSESILHMTKGHGMKNLIGAAKLLERHTIVVVCPDKSSLTAVNKAINEGLVAKVILVGDTENIRQSCREELLFPRRYEFVNIPAGGEPAEQEAESALAGTRLIREGQGDMLMKGKINTAPFIRAVLNRETGISIRRRLSMVSLFELPGVDRLILLTDAGINPELFLHQEADSAVDIIENAIGVARSLGVERPKVALLEANEVPSEKIPTSMLEKALSERRWDHADVFGPLSYDLALYPESVAKKGITSNPVAGKADVLVVPNISGGNFLYKTWVMTLGADVANVVLGANVPILLTSRSDTEVNKFLTICASILYSHFLRKNDPAK
jgi:phosphate butyryltransferase